MGWTPLASGPEFDRIRSFARAAGDALPDGVRVPPGDDAAAVELEEDEVPVVSVDAFAEGIHFRREWSGWEAVGYRSAAAALSDLAAMAARPVGLLAAVLLPPELDVTVLRGLARGIGECLRDADAGLLGGDLSGSQEGVTVSLTAVGGAASPVERGGGRPGDELWVTGRLGGAATAVADWSRGLEPEPGARRAYERPRPRHREARWLARRAELRGLVDLSDGLAGDVAHVAAAAGLAAELRTDRVPMADALSGYDTREVALRLALTGGEDYELLLAVAPGSLEEEGVRDFREAFGLDLTRVGRLAEGEGVRLRDASGRVQSPGNMGWDHFAPGRGE